MPSKKKKIDLTRHAPEYLQHFSREHLLYEVGMLFYLGRILMIARSQAPPPSAADVLHNATLESFVLHLRNLLDFFYSAPTHDTDVKAAMFYDTGQLPLDFPPKSAMLQEAHSRAHKEMSHITTERHWEGSPEKEWKFHLLMMEIKPALEKFTQTASATRLHPEFAQRAKALSEATP